jgi:nucleoside-diphosphate-sugar epimerase
LKILVTGAAGMIGRKLCERLAREGRLGGKAIAALHMVDVVEPKPPHASFQIKTGAADISQEAAVGALVAGKPDVIFHLAAIVSGEASAISTRATPSISTAAAFSSMRSGASPRQAAAPTSRGSSMPLPRRFSARPSRTASPTNSI